MKNPSIEEIENLNKYWDGSIKNLPGVIVAIQKSSLPGTAACDNFIRKIWSAMPVLKKQKTV
jgi:hypothetical protein